MIAVVNGKEMEELDRRATAEYGIPSLLLMENAGVQVVLEMLRFFPDLAGARVAVLCGKGNNGGDGFVVARHLANRGIECRAYLVGRRAEVKGDARVNLDILDRMGVPILEIGSKEDLHRQGDALARASILVDALLGTGAAGPAKGLLADAITLVNDLGRPVVAVDIPSGLGAGDAHPPGPAIQAALTVTFALPKRSLVLYPAAKLAGTLRVVDIGIPRPLLTDPAWKLHLLEAADVLPAFPPRDPNAHKGTYGHVLVVAGSAGKTGAAAMASLAALRVGAGLVTLALPDSLNDLMEAKLTEVMTEGLPETEERTVALAALDKLLGLLEGKSALVVGPGLSTHPATVQLVRELIGLVKVPTILDADGLNALAGRVDVLGKAGVPLVLTPHPGELCRLLGIGREEVIEKRVPIAQKAAASLNVHLALKGARTVVADPKGEATINPTGNPGMATAGMGDVLAGIIGGLVGQGVETGLATRAGVYLHGLAGDLAAADLGPEALLAGDVLDRMSGAIRALKAAGHPEGARAGG